MKISNICYRGSYICKHIFPSQKMSYSRVSQLRELQSIIEEISRAIMWVNEREEEELVFDWGEKNIDQYIPRKQESYSVRLTSQFVAENISLTRHVFLFFSGLIGLGKCLWGVTKSDQIVFEKGFKDGKRIFAGQVVVHCRVWGQSS